MSVVGLPISLWGLKITYDEAKKSRNSAEAASKAALQMRESLKRSVNLSEISAIIEKIGEIKRLHTENNRILVVEKYTYIIPMALKIDFSISENSTDHESTIQGLVGQLVTMETSVAGFVKFGKPALNEVKMNEILSKYIVKLNSIKSLFMDEKSQNGK